MPIGQLNRRKAIKVLHWTAFFLLLYFFFVEPDEVERGPDAAKSAALSTHAGVGFLLAIVTGVWSVMFLIKGPAGRPGPKLPAWGKRLHPILNTGLYYLLPIMVLTGALSGLLAPFAVMGFGVIPLNFGVGVRGLHSVMTEIHEITFDALTLLAIAHLCFHIGRHVLLKDNALKIMAPRALHRYL